MGAVKQQKPVETGEYGECVDPKHVLHLDSNGRGKKKRFANKNAICSNFVGLLFKLS